MPMNANTPNDTLTLTEAEVDLILQNRAAVMSGMDAKSANDARKGALEFYKSVAGNLQDAPADPKLAAIHDAFAAAEAAWVALTTQANDAVAVAVKGSVSAVSLSDSI